MTQPRDAYHHGDLRNALVASAVRLIEASGPGAFSLREAAREVGVSANAAYRHFDDKSALITAVAADGFARLAERMRRAMASASAGRGDEPVSIARFKAGCKTSAHAEQVSKNRSRMLQRRTFG
jgi:AcrR family transcriptional regulator